MMILARLFADYIDTIVAPILIFIILLLLALYKKSRIGIVINVYLHGLALIDWFIINGKATDNIGIYNLANAIKVGIIDLIAIIALIIYLVIRKESKKNNDTKSEEKIEVVESQKICLHCGISNPKENEYCKQCGNKL